MSTLVNTPLETAAASARAASAEVASAGGSQSDAELLAAFVARRDEPSFAQLVGRHGPMVQAVCRRVLQDGHDAEDALQATFLVLARSASKIRRPERLASWLYGVAYRVSRRLQRRQPPPVRELSMDDFQDHESPLDVLTRRYDCQAVVREVYRLPAALRQPIILRYMSGQPYQEIARQLGISPTAVDGRLKRARRRLRFQLARQGISLGVGLTWLQLDRAQAALAPAQVAQVVSYCTSSASVAPSALPSNIKNPVYLAHQEITSMAMMNITRWAAVAVASAFGVLVVGNAMYSAEGRAGGGSRQGGDVFVAAQDPGAAEDAVLLVQADPFGPSDAAEPVTSNQPQDVGPSRPAAPETPAERYYDAKPRSAAVQRIESALGSPTTVQFTDTPLATVAEYLGDLHSIQIVLDHKGLEEAGLPSDVPITANLQGIPLESALELVLDSLDMQAIIAHDVLLITSAESAEQLIEVRVYPYHEDWPMGAQQLATLISQAIEPESWVEAGGMNFISAFGGSSTGLVVSANDRVHRKINDFLGQLTALMAGASAQRTAGSMSSPRGSRGPDIPSASAGPAAANPYPAPAAVPSAAAPYPPTQPRAPQPAAPTAPAQPAAPPQAASPDAPATSAAPQPSAGGFF